MRVNDIVAVFRQHGDHRQRALIQRLKQAGPRAFPQIKAICTGDYAVSIQRWAVEALGAFARRQSLPLLRRALMSPHMSVRLHALLGVVALDEPRLANYLRPLLRDESGGVRINALSAVSTMKPRWLKAELTAALKDEKPYVRKLAKRLLLSD